MKESNKESKEEIQKEGDRAVSDSREDLRVDFDAFLRFFNQTLREAGSNIAQVAYLSRGYRHRLQYIVNSYNTKQALLTAVRKMTASDFLNGRIKSAKRKVPFKASLIWLLESDEHFDKVLNGYYDNPPDADKTAEEQRAEEAERRRQDAADRRAEAARIYEEEKQREREARERAFARAVTPEEAAHSGVKLSFLKKIMEEK